MTSSASVQVLPDGSVSLLSGQVDLTGTRTTMQQIVADEMQIPIGSVTVRVGDTESSPYTDLSAGSRTTYSLGAAAHEACKDAIEQIKIHAATISVLYSESVLSLSLMEIANSSVKVTVWSVAGSVNSKRRGSLS